MQVAEAAARVRQGSADGVHRQRQERPGLAHAQGRHRARADQQHDDVRAAAFVQHAG